MNSSSSDWSSDGDSTMIRINGTAKNTVPRVANEIPDQEAEVGVSFSYTFPVDITDRIFADADNDPLRYTASGLPSWLSFDASTRTFSGTPPSADAGERASVRVTASDGRGGSASDTFDIIVTAPVLVSNLDEDVSRRVFTSDSHSNAMAQHFTTGSGGGVLQEVTVSIRAASRYGNPDFALYSSVDDNGVPKVGEKLVDLEGGTVGPGNYTVAPASAYQLGAGVTYFVVLGVSSGTIKFEATNTSQSGKSGWAIGNTPSAFYKRSSVTSPNGFNGAIRMGIGGTTGGGANNAPTVANPIPDQNVVAETRFTYTWPENTFADADSLDTLSYTVTLSDGSALPGWLVYLPHRRLFAGTAPSAQTVTVKVTANDDRGGSISDEFDIIAAAAPSVRVLVANVTSDGDGGDPPVGNHGRVSQQFTTGANSGGYNLASIGVQVLSENLSAGETFTVRIYEGSETNVLYTLTSPDSYRHNAVNQFQAPAGATLKANTTYRVQFVGGGNHFNDFKLDGKIPNREDIGSLPGWSIADAYLNNGTPNRSSVSVMISVSGTEERTGLQIGEEPTVAAIEAEKPADASWDAGDALTLSVRFDQEVVVDTADGTPALSATVGTTQVSVPYASGSGSDTLTFSTTLAAGTASSSSVNVAANALALNGGAIEGTDGQAANLDHIGYAFAASAGQNDEVGDPLTVSTESKPDSHDGSSAFTVRLRFSDRLKNGKLGDKVVRITGGTHEGSSRAYSVTGDLWDIRVTPDGTDDVTLSLAGSDECGSGIACTEGDLRPLSADFSVTVPGPEEEETNDLTAWFVSPETDHDGTSAFPVRIAFSERLKNSKLGSKVVRITGGTHGGSQRIDNDDTETWLVTVTPDGTDDITIKLVSSDTCGSGIACTAEDHRPLSAGITHEVRGPALFSVADSQATEGTDTDMTFTVSLDRALAWPATVDYATGDGTAVSPADYTATSGTLTFSAGQTSKTVQVPIVDDAHDDDGETFTLALSNAVGAAIDDGTATATGTIRNRDPLQQAWIARFGRTVGTQAVDAVTGRMGGGGPTHVTLGGRSLPLGGGSSGLAGANEEKDAESGVDGTGDLSLTAHEGTGPDGELEKETGEVETVEKVVAEWLRSSVGEDENLVLPDLDTLMLGSSFNLSLEDRGAGPGSQKEWSAWGRFARDSFEGAAEGLAVEGDVTTGFVGMDVESGSWLWGAALGISEGEGPYRMAEDGATAPPEDDTPQWGSGRMESNLTAVYPYGRYAVTDRLDLWAMGGYGQGTMTVEPAGGSPLETDLGMTLGVIGARGTLREPPPEGGIALILRADALWVRTESEALRSGSGFLSGAQADTSRMRLILEGERAYRLPDGGTITPALELGVRRDGGDAETGTGIETGARVSFKRQGLTIEGAVRTLLSHEDEEYGEWGASASIRLEPGRDGRGLSFSVAPSWGATGSAAERLWGLDDTRGLAPDGEFEAGRRIDARVGYGLPVFGGRFTGTPEFGLGLSDGAREYRIGWRLSPVGGGIGPFGSFGIHMEAVREVPSRGESKSRFGVVLEARF